MQRRRRLAAFRHRVRASRMEVAAGGRVERRRDLALDRHERALGRRHLARLREQRLRVGMIGLREELRRRRALDDAAQVHDDDAVRDVLDDAQVVADEKVREVERALEFHEEVEHLRLDRDVERRHRLVAHQELRLDGERPRNADARALAAGELMRIAAHERRVEPDAVQHQADVFDLLRAADHRVRDRRLADDVQHAHPRIERRVGILEDHLHLELLPARRRRVLAGERRALPEALAGRQRQQPDGHASERRLAASGLADEPDHFAGRHDQVDVVHRVDDFLLQSPRRTCCRSCAARSSDFTKRFDTPFSSTRAATSPRSRCASGAHACTGTSG